MFEQLAPWAWPRLRLYSEPQGVSSRVLSKVNASIHKASPQMQKSKAVNRVKVFFGLLKIKQVIIHLFRI
jgi:hypothetical protein